MIELTLGNINNDHLYLTSIMDLPPAASVGGCSQAGRASQVLEAHREIGDSAHTDIAGDKKILHKRAWGMRLKLPMV